MHPSRPAGFDPRTAHTNRRGARPAVECLETRSLLSAAPLTGFPSHGFRADRLGADAPWDVPAFVDGILEHATAFAEGSETLADAPSVSLVANEPAWFAGVVGDTLLRGASAVTNDVDLYRIELPKDDHYSLQLTVLAQRFGSELDAAVSLFDADGRFIASNDDAFHDGYLSDSELFHGLDSGTYFVAVSAGGNTPDQNGGFHVNRPGSGTSSRGGRGQYLLRIEAVPDSTRPEVVATNIRDGATLDAPPTWITVQFSEAMALAGLERGATLTDSGGHEFALTHIHYDSLTNEMTYLVLDRAEAGHYEFRLSAETVTDRADNPLQGNDASGDFVVHFHVDTAEVSLADLESNESIDAAQPLETLFEHDLQPGIRLSGVVPESASETDAVDHDFYRFKVLREAFFTFRFKPNAGLPAGATISLRDASGELIVRTTSFTGFGTSVFRFMTAGEYTVEIAAPTAVTAATYQLTIQSAGTGEITLTDNSPGAAVQVVLRSNDGSASAQTSATSGNAAPSNLVIASGEIVASVSALPVVAGGPLGRPQSPAADASELAWVDTSDSGALPAGVTFGRPAQPSTHFSVERVSGSFLEPLPDDLRHGTHALAPAAGLVAELAELFRTSGAARPDGNSSEDAALDGSAAELFAASDSTDAALEDSRRELSPRTIAFGMAVALGVASAATVPSRRRNSNWLQQTFEALGAI